MSNCIFEPRTDTSSATICKHCGQEKFMHQPSVDWSCPNVEKLATEWVDKNSHKWSNNTDEVGDNYGSFVAGYNQAKENLYTEEQVREAIVKASLSTTDSLIDKCNEIIQSLKQHKQ